MRKIFSVQIFVLLAGLGAIFAISFPEIALSENRGLSIAILALAFALAYANRGHVLPQRLLALLIVILAAWNLVPTRHLALPILALTIPLNAALSLLLLASATTILSYQRYYREKASLALVLALAAGSIATVALYGHATGTGLGYRWMSSQALSLTSAIYLLMLACAVGTIAWSRFQSPGGNLAEILKEIQLISGSVFFLTVALSAAFGIMPLYQLIDNADPPFIRSAFEEKIPYVTGALAVITALSGSFVFLLMRKLVLQIGVLEGKLQQSLLTIEGELGLRKDAQLRAETSLREKEVLLREVHHRVKNNLQVVSSILNLQLRRENTGPVAVTLQESVSRIHSIAVLHETLYKSQDLGKIHLGEYLKELTQMVRRSWDGNSRPTINISAGDILIDIDRVLPIGLIITELLTNSFKYAFAAPSATSLIRIVINSFPSGDLLISFVDNGAGFPKGFKVDEASSLGWKLIHTLVGQLKGEVRLVSGGGAHVEIRIPRIRQEVGKPLVMESVGYDKAPNPHS